MVVSGTFDFDHEMVLRNRRYETAAGQYATRPISDVVGVRREQFVSGIKQGVRGQEQAFRDACSHDDLVPWVIADLVQAFQVRGYRFAQGKQPVVRRVVGLASAGSLESGFRERLRRDEVRLADAQRDTAVHIGD